jgi:hypothetical protein
MALWALWLKCKEDLFSLSFRNIMRGSQHAGSNCERHADSNAVAMMPASIQATEPAHSKHMTPLQQQESSATVSAFCTSGPGTGQLY